jgi:hypothetical protein
MLTLSFLALAIPAAARAESVSLFDGKTLAGWQGKAGLWSVVDGAIFGSTKPNGIGGNTFLVHQKPFANFILTLDFQLHGGNSGIQLRSAQVDKPEDFVIAGYQADIGEGYFGSLYDEKRRGMLAEARKDWVKRFLKDPAKNEWNRYEISAIGSTITCKINGLITAEYTEKDANIPRSGLIALQLHGGGPMEVRFKDIRIEEIPQKKLLYVTTAAGFAHSSRPLSRDVTAQLGRDSGRFEVTATDTTELITPAGLKGFDALMFYTTGGLENFPLSKENREAMIQWVKDGHAFIGVHSATDTYADWEPYWEMIGGSFDGHPWNAGDPAITVDVEDPSHPAAIPVPHGWKVQDEIYQFKNYSRDRLHIILSMNVDDEAHRKKGKRSDNDYPLAWCRDFQKGKVFHTSLGHREDVWTNPTYQAHLLGGILWALGTPGYESDATPGLPKPDNKFTDLLDGKTLSGWTQNDVKDARAPGGKKVEAEWEVVDGVLQGKGQQGHLFSPKEYVNFHYSAEARINDGGNSGMYFRARRGQAWPQGYEAQVNSSHGDPVRTGSLYNIKKVFEQLVPPDTWFTQEIIAYGDHIVIKVNGKVTANVVHPGGHKKGHFAFQFHDPTCKVQYRNVKVRELPSLEGKKTAKVD